MPLSVCRSVSVRNLTHKLVFRSDPLDRDHSSELYDLVADPYELSNRRVAAPAQTLLTQLHTLSFILFCHFVFFVCLNSLARTRAGVIVFFLCFSISRSTTERTRRR